MTRLGNLRQVHFDASLIGYLRKLYYLNFPAIPGFNFLQKSSHGIILPASLLVKQGLRNVAFLFGLDDMNFAVELCPPALDLLRGLLVKVDERAVVGRDPLLRDPEHGAEDSDQKPEDLLDHDLEVRRLGDVVREVGQLTDKQLGQVDDSPSGNNR